MKKLVKKDKLADSGGASYYTPTCSSANRKKDRM